MTASLAALHRSLGIPADYAARRRLSLHAEAGEADLVVIVPNAGDGAIRLAAPAAAAWQHLHAAAAREGIALLPLSGFRSIARQAGIVRSKLAAGQAIADILRTIAAPGYSEHHTGRALDLGTPGEPPLAEGFAATTAFAWLTRHAGEFGFVLSYPRNNPHGIAFEPWHWCWHNAPDA